jgi:hypothetical protein
MSAAVPNRWSLLLAGPVLALVAVAGCAEDVSPAARVGDTKISDADLLDEVDEWANNEQAFDTSQLATLNPGTYPMRLVDVILQQRIDLALHEEKFDELGLELDDEMRQQALFVLFQGDLSTAEQALSGFSDDYAEAYVDDIGRQIAVESELGQTGYVAWRNEAYVDADIEVSPRYGRWDPEQQSVVGPEGPIQPALETTEL